MSGNLGNTFLKKKISKGGRMEEFDRLPPQLRSWLRDACLPWSPSSVKRVYLKALKSTGDYSSALLTLDTMQSRQLTKERLNGRQSSSRENIRS